MREGNIYYACAASIVAASVAIGCGGGGGGAATPTTPGTNLQDTIGATIRINANGLVPADVSILPGQRVRFINDDTRPHQIQTNPHLFHTDCPANNIAILNPGQSVETGQFVESKGCGFHNHLLPDQQTYWGVIRVGSGDAPGPVYSRGW